MAENSKPKEEQDPRAKREHTTREVEARNAPWTPPTILPVPDKEDGYVFRWVRIGIRGESDMTNVSRKFREGWEPVRLEDHPEMKLIPDINSKFEGMAVLGNLMLCKNTVERMQQKREYQMDINRTQMEAVDNNFMREQDARMPLLNPERKTRITFGDGS